MKDLFKIKNEGELRQEIIGGNAVEDAVTLLGIIMVMQWYEHGSDKIAASVVKGIKEDGMLADKAHDIADGFVGLVTMAYTSASVFHPYFISRIRGMMRKPTRQSKRVV